MCTIVGDISRTHLLDHRIATFLFISPLLGSKLQVFKPQLVNSFVLAFHVQQFSYDPPCFPILVFSQTILLSLQVMLILPQLTALVNHHLHFLYQPSLNIFGSEYCRFRRGLIALDDLLTALGNPQSGVFIFF